MRPKFPMAAERGRVMSGPMFSESGDRYGVFMLRGPHGMNLGCIVNDGTDWEKHLPGEPWEHVSVSVEGQSRLPNWLEMKFVKEMFWGDEECVVQIHPPKSEYINVHRMVLHLWKPPGSNLATPPKECV